LQDPNNAALSANQLLKIFNASTDYSCPDYIDDEELYDMDMTLSPT